MSLWSSLLLSSCTLNDPWLDWPHPDHPGSVQFSHSDMSDFLHPHGLQHIRLPCLSPTPGACSNSSHLSRWCHPTISASVVHFSSCLQSFPTKFRVFFRSQFLVSGGQSNGVSASALVLPVNIQDWFLSGLMIWSNGHTKYSHFIQKEKRLANMYRYIFKNKSKTLSLELRKHTVTFMS